MLKKKYDNKKSKKVEKKGKRKKIKKYSNTNFRQKTYTII